MVLLKHGDFEFHHILSGGYNILENEPDVVSEIKMADGTIKRNMSRKFKIKTVYGQDDPRCMEEVVTRRLKHSLDSNSSGFGRLPDVLFADGGITQIRAIKAAMKKCELNIPVFGMVKNDKHQTRALMDENRKELEISENLKNLITKFQDEVHDTAISYHRKLRDAKITKSELDGKVVANTVNKVNAKQRLQYGIA